MKRNKSSIQETLKQYLSRYGEPSQGHVDSAVERVWQKLEPEAVGAPLVLPVKTGARHSWRFAAILAPAAVVALIVFLQIPRTIEVQAVVADGSLSRVSGEKNQIVHAGERIAAGEILRTNDANSSITLADGSRVEMRSQSEFSVERAEDGVRIHLFKGRLIINAAKQLAGHLYVQTKDVTVSVVGTVFLVNAEEEGSRVAVIEGEVRVQQGTTTKNLLPGEQLSTNPQMQPLAVKEEVSWSSSAEIHMALLQQSAPVPTASAPKRLEFEVAAIRPQPAGVRGARSAFACQGSDGIVAPDGAPPLTSGVPRGRCSGQIAVPQLVGLAYGVPRQNVSGGPEWIRQPFQAFQIEAKAADPGSVTAEDLRQMLQTLLMDRFKLKFHRESQELQQYVLRTAKTGLKLKTASGADEAPHMVPADLGRLGIAIKGTSEVRKLADFLVTMVGFPVKDGTSLTGTYEYLLKLNIVEGQRGGGNGVRGAGGGGDGNITVTQFDPPVSTALQEQLGLQLDMEKVLTEVIVIDQAERPADN